MFKICLTLSLAIVAVVTSHGASQQDEPADGQLRWRTQNGGFQVLGNKTELRFFVCQKWYWFEYRSPDRSFIPSGGRAKGYSYEQYMVCFDGKNVTAVNVRFDKPRLCFHPNIDRVMRLDDDFYLVKGYYGFRKERGFIHKLDGSTAVLLDDAETRRIERRCNIDLSRFWPRMDEETKKAGWSFLAASPNLFIEERDGYEFRDFRWNGTDYTIKVETQGRSKHLRLRTGNAAPVTLLSWRAGGPLTFPGIITFP